VVRVVNFAHGEMTTIAMYVAIVLFSALGLDPLVDDGADSRRAVAFGYAMQAGLINPFHQTARATASSSCWSRSPSSSSMCC